MTTRVRSSQQNPGRAASRSQAEVPSRDRSGTKGADLIITILVVLGSLHALFMIGVESYRAVQSQQAIARLNSEIDHLEQDIQVFNAVIENGDDQQYREQLARRQGFIYPEELRIVTVPLRVTERP